MADLRMDYSPFMSTHEAIEWFKVQLQLLIDGLILKAKHQEGFA